MSTRTVALVTLVLAALIAPFPSAAHAGSDDEQEPFLTIAATEAARWCSDDFGCVEPAADVYYNRVDGLLFFMGARYRSESHLHPRLRAVAGWQSARSGSAYEIDVEQPLFGQDSFSFGVSLYDRTAFSCEDAENITSIENSLYAVLLRQEQRDYYREEGYTVFARQRMGRRLRLAVEYHDAALSSLSTRQDVWSLFRQGADWRENPPLRVGIEGGEREFEGRTNLLEVTLTYDGREGLDRRGAFARARVEDARDRGNGGYKYRRISFDGSRRMRITDTQALTLRGAWGVGSGTDFPSHRLFYLGGLGTLRGYPYRAYEAKNLAFVSAEYAVRIRPELEIIYFLDSGEVWNNTTGFDWEEHKTNIGIGLRVDVPGIGDIRLDAARPTTTENVDTVVSLRLVYPS